MGSRVAQWAFAAFYLVVAIIAVWGGFNELNPPLPEALRRSTLIRCRCCQFRHGYGGDVLFPDGCGVSCGRFLQRSRRDARAGKAGDAGRQSQPCLCDLPWPRGAYLLWYGGQLLMLGGSFAYALSGIALLATTFFLIMRKPLGALIYAGIVVLWVVLSILEAGVDFLALLPRLAAWLVVGLWFLTPWHRAAMGKTPETPINAGGLWVGLATAAGAVLLVVGAVQGYPVVEGTKNEVAAGPAVTDWRNYGGVPEGQRFAQIDQINVENVGKLKEAWRARTGVAYDFKQTPQMANGLVYICTAGNTLLAYDSDTGEKRWQYDTKTEVPGGLDRASTFARTCRGLGYHEAPPEYTGECAKRIIAGTVDARLIAWTR
jgi:quinoprotein glucose dehydrogenase